MLWARWRGCVAGMVLLFLMGCAGERFQAFIMERAASTSGNYVVAGSLENTAMSLQAKLKQLGVSAVATQEGEGIRIASNTPNGEKFTVVLTRVHDQEVESTRVRYEWGKGSDGQRQVLASLVAMNSSPTTVPPK